MRISHTLLFGPKQRDLPHHAAGTLPRLYFTLFLSCLLFRLGVLEAY